MTLLAGLLLSSLTITATVASDVEYLIIVHQDNPTALLGRDQIDAIFLGKIRKWPTGTDVSVVSHRDPTLRDLFAKSIHSRPDTAVSAYWAAKAFRDSIAPPAKLEDDEIVRYVADRPGAVGFVHAGAPLTGVKVLRVAD